MRGLKPPPLGTGRIAFEIDVDGWRVSTAWRFLCPGGATGDVEGAEEIADNVVLLASGSIANMMSRAATIVACDVTLFAFGFARARVQLDGIPGLWEGAQNIGLAAGLRWAGDVRGRGTASVSRIPSVPDEFVRDSRQLSQHGYVVLNDNAVTFLNTFDAIPSPYGGTLTLGTVHFVHHGAPADPPTFEPFISVTPSPHLCTTPRRLPRGRQISTS